MYHCFYFLNSAIIRTSIPEADSFKDKVAMSLHKSNVARVDGFFCFLTCAHLLSRTAIAIPELHLIKNQPMGPVGGVVVFYEVNKLH